MFLLPFQCRVATPPVPRIKLFVVLILLFWCCWEMLSKIIYVWVEVQISSLLFFQRLIFHDFFFLCSFAFFSFSLCVSFAFDSELLDCCWCKNFTLIKNAFKVEQNFSLKLKLRNSQSLSITDSVVLSQLSPSLSWSLFVLLSDVKMIIALEFFTEKRERDFAVIKELKINCFANNINLWWA